MDLTQENVINLFNSLAENAAVVVFNTDHEIVYASNLFAQTLGYRVDELMGKLHGDLCFSDFTDSPAYTTFWRNLLQGQSYRNKVVRKAKDGSKVVLEARYFPVKDVQGKIIGVGKIAFNKTEEDSQQQAALNNNVDQLTEISEKLSELSSTGTSKLEDLADVMSTVIGSSEKNITSTEELKQRTSEIENITDTVHEIAYQTNMLAVNAALESTRAGTDGKGFSVVAQEMRKLAAQVDEASRGIQQTVGGIITEVENIIDSSKKTGNSITTAKDVLQENKQSFDELLEHSKLLASTVNDLNQLFKIDQTTQQA